MLDWILVCQVLCFGRTKMVFRFTEYPKWFVWFELRYPVPWHRLAIYMVRLKCMADVLLQFVLMWCMMNRNHSKTSEVLYTNSTGSSGEKDGFFTLNLYLDVVQTWRSNFKFWNELLQNNDDLTDYLWRYFLFSKYNSYSFRSNISFTNVFYMESIFIFCSQLVWKSIYYFYLIYYLNLWCFN